MESKTLSGLEVTPLQVFLAVVDEKSFSRAAQRVLRTQPAVSLAVRKLERQLGETLIDRSSRDVRLTDAGQLVADCARRHDNLLKELHTGLAELRDKDKGRVAIGANESTILYLLPHIAAFRRLYPRIQVRVQRSLSSEVPAKVASGDLELGLISYEPADERLASTVLYTDRLAFVVSPRHRLAGRKTVSIAELGMETFVAHNVVSPYRQEVLRAFEKHRVPLHMDIEMPTVETIRRMVEGDDGVAFLPRMCVERDLERGTLVEVRVKELAVERKIRLVTPAQRPLSHAARAFLEEVRRKR